MSCSSIIKKAVKTSCAHSNISAGDYLLIDARQSGAQGFLDRRSVIRWLLNLAFAVCGRLLFPPPCVSLDPLHNNGTEVSCTLSWSDYVQVSHPQLLIDAVPSNHSRILEVPEYWGWRCHNILKKQSRSWVSRMGHNITIQPSSRLRDMANGVLDDIGLSENTTFIGLHIRRGDAVKTCNTAVHRVVKKVRKFFSSTNSTGLPAPLLYWSDETESAYHADLTKALMAIEHTLISRVIHVDPILHPVAQNNYDVFAAELILEDRARATDTFIELRRHYACRR
mmetsp:Transcript_13417/g.40457  ORF Transcript_13417/g.40457 Transcript_13417/m.40457 type:complete len:281 (+) Transcript_13417:58-900(+)